MGDLQLSVPTGPLSVKPLSSQGSVWFSLVVPTYNEGQNVESLVQQVVNILDEKYQGRYEIIFVDDNSPDGTAHQVEKLAVRFPQLRLLVRTSERGLATAVVRGWQQAQGEVIGVIDGDLQHPVSILPELLAKVEAGADLVLGSRYRAEGGLGNWGLARRLASRSAFLMAFFVLPEVTCRVSDPMSGCFALRRQAIAGVVLKPEGYKILLEVLARGRIRQVEEVDYVFQLRQRGETKAGLRQLVEYFVQLTKLRLFLWKRLVAQKDN